MSASHEQVSKYRLILLACTVFITLAFMGMVWLRPWILGLYFQIQGGKQLQAALQSAGVAEDIACTNDPLTDGASVQGLEQAIENLTRATAHYPDLAQAYLLLGRANCALGEYEEAVKAYEEYARLRPENPLGHLELGFGLETTYSQETNGLLAVYTQIIANPTTHKAIHVEWGKANIGWY